MSRGMSRHLHQGQVRAGALDVVIPYVKSEEAKFEKTGYAPMANNSRL